MVCAKQLKTLGLSWFRPEPYVQQGCARGTVLLCTGVPVVGRLQARRKRRRGLQVSSGVIEASANIVGEDGDRVCVVSSSQRGGSPSFYRPRRGSLFSYMWRYGVQCRGVGGRPGGPCPGLVVAACPVLEQGRLRG
jgi:hypothetical protein